MSRSARVGLQLALVAGTMCLSACLRRSPSTATTLTATTAASQSESALEQALAGRDPAGIVAVFDTVAELRSWSNRTYTGNGQIAVYLISLTADVRNPIALQPGRFVQCRDGGVFEQNGTFEAPLTGGQVTHGWFSAMWFPTDRGTVARRIVMAADSTTSRDSFACEPGAPVAPVVATFSLAGTRLIVSAGANVMAPSLAISRIRDEMRTRGFSFKRDASTLSSSGPAAEDWPQTTSLYVTGALGLRTPIRGALDGELRVGAGTSEKAASYHSALSRYMEVTTFPLTISALAGTTQGGMHVSLGPSLLFPNWRMHQDDRVMTRSGSNTAWSITPGTDSSATVSSPALGGMGQFELETRGERLSYALQIQIDAYLQQTLPAMKYFPSMSPKQRNVRLSISVRRS